MRIAGVEPKARVETVVIPFGDSEIVIKAQFVKDDDFEKLNPRPLPPTITYPDGRKVEDVKDADYLKKMNDWATSRFDYLVINSLKASSDLVFETVDYSDASTWGNYRQELEDFGLSALEVSKIIEAVINACGMNVDKITEATEAFLAKARAE